MTPTPDPRAPAAKSAAGKISEAVGRARQELDARLPRSRFARMRDLGEDRIMELELEDHEPPGARLEIHLGPRGAGGPIEARLFDAGGHHVGVRISERELRAIALTATSATAWIGRA